MSSQVDNRNSSATKRARTDGSRREDDWTCPSCGNVNFSFRTTCNMRNCTQSRPADHNSKPALKPLQAPPSYALSAAYPGSGAPSSVYFSAPPYGSSLFNGTPLPTYDLSFSGGSGYHYDYNSRLSVGSPYGALHLSAPSPYSSGSMLGTGGMYGTPLLMDRYGLALPMGHAAMGARPGAFPDENPQKKAADAGRDNDWTCPECGNVNFSFRTVCNMRKCGTPKPGSQTSRSENSKGSKSKMPEGSWKCEKCNNINYPFRTKCNRQNCGAEKPSESNNSAGMASDEDDKEQPDRGPRLQYAYLDNCMWMPPTVFEPKEGLLYTFLGFRMPAQVACEPPPSRMNSSTFNIYMLLRKKKVLLILGWLI